MNAVLRIFKEKGFGSQKFVYDNNEPKNVFTFLGISYHQEFEKALSIHPAAFNEMRASPFRVAGTLSLLTAVAMSVKILSMA